MIVQMKLSREEAKKLWHITQAASQHLKKEYNVATLCLNIVRSYLKEHYIEVRDD